MTRTNQPQGSRPDCPACGMRSWSFEGYCLSVQCAGSWSDPGWPKSRPKDREDQQVGSKKPKQGKARPPKKGLLRSETLYYEYIGEKPPWEQKDEDHA